LYPSANAFLDKYGLLEAWGDTSVYKNREGEIIPEIKDMMWAIKSYYLAKSKHGGTSNSPYDIG
jgi:hypothetical protein